MSDKTHRCLLIGLCNAVQNAKPLVDLESKAVVQCGSGRAIDLRLRARRTVGPEAPKPAAPDTKILSDIRLSAGNEQLLAIYNSRDELTAAIDSWTELDELIGVHLMIYDHDDLRGALHPDAKKRSPRGDLRAVRSLLNDLN